MVRKGPLELGGGGSSDFSLFRPVVRGSPPGKLVARGRRLYPTGGSARAAVPNLVEPGGNRFRWSSPLSRLGIMGVGLGVYILVCGVVLSSAAEVRLGPARPAGVEAALGELFCVLVSRSDCKPEESRAQCSVVFGNSDECGGLGLSFGIWLSRSGGLTYLVACR